MLTKVSELYYTHTQSLALPWPENIRYTLSLSIRNLTMVLPVYKKKCLQIGWPQKPMPLKRLPYMVRNTQANCLFYFTAY